MAEHVRIKIGEVEVEYEGDKGFVESKIIQFFNDFAEAVSSLPVALLSKPKIDASPSQVKAIQNPSDSGLNLSVGTIATRLAVTSGTDLARAAAAYLALVEAQASFSRKQINEAMKSATGFFKETYRKNLTNQLRSLVKQKVLNEISKDTYALTSQERRTLEKQLA